MRAPISWSAHTSEAARASASSVLTYLEINGWLYTGAGVTVLIDPVLEGALDFGIPRLYSAQKRTLPSSGLIDTLPPLDALLITQGLDDHAHARTLAALRDRDPTLPVIAAPSCRPVLERGGFERTTYLASTSQRLQLPYLGLDGLPPVRLPPSRAFAGTATIVPRRRRGGRSYAAAGSDQGLTVRATSGALVGPPWQRRENGYVLRPRTPRGGASVYLEPHVEFDAAELADIAPVDVVITPTSGQTLPGFELVHGPDAALSLVECLRPRWVLPMSNGAVDAAGLSAPFISEIGGRGDFERRLRASNVAGSAEVVAVQPGEPVVVGPSA